MIAFDIQIAAIPESFADLVRARLDAAWGDALAMTAAEIVERGHVNGKGEPVLGVIATWQFGQDPFDVTGLDVALAENGDDDRINSYMSLLRRDEEARECLVADVLGLLHLHAARQLNGPRPLADVSDGDLVDLVQQWHSPVPAPDVARDDVAHASRALETFAQEEIQYRKDKGIWSDPRETRSALLYSRLLQSSINRPQPSRAAREPEPESPAGEDLDALMDSIELNTPILPMRLMEIVRKRVGEAWEVAVQMPVSEIARRGCVDHRGEPGVGLVVTWKYRDGQAGIDDEGALDVEDLAIAFAETDDDTRADAYITPFRERSIGVDRLVCRLIERLHMQGVRRMNPSRPLAGLEDHELEAFTHKAPFVDHDGLDVGPRVLKRRALGELAGEEAFHIRPNASAHDRIYREDARRARHAERA